MNSQNVLIGYLVFNFEVFYTFLVKSSSQLLYVSLEYISLSAMLEMRPCKPITTTPSIYISQEITEVSLKMRSGLLEVPSSLGLQDAEI